MVLLLTTAGEAHLAALEGQGAPVADFDGLVLGRGNDVPAASDTYQSISEQIAEAVVLDGYPKKNDMDPRNGGRGADRWTWAFELAPGVPLVASNLGIADKNATGAAPLLVSGRLGGEDILAKHGNESLIVFVNAKAGEVPTLFRATRTNTVAARRAAWTPRSRALAMSVEGESTTSERKIARPGERVRVMALMPNDEGGVLSAAEVVSGELAVFRRTRGGGWEPVGQEPLSDPVSENLILGDPRWPHEGGYNASADWRVPTIATALEYALELRVRAGIGQTPRIESFEIPVEASPTAARR